MKIRTALLTVPIVVLTLVAGLAAPASAMTPYDVTMLHGQFVIGTGPVKMPNTVPCPSEVSLAGTIDPTDPTDNMTGTLDASIAWFVAIVPPGNSYVFTATGSGTGTNAGVFDPGTGSFAGLQIPSVAFTVKNLNSATCVVGSTVCSGTLSTLTFGGGLYNGSTFPLTNPESFYVNATATVATRGTCAFPFSVFITVGTSVSLGDNPDTDYAPIGFPDPGAIFQA